MATFRVGQRVRVIHPTSRARGHEATILSFGHSASHRTDGQTVSADVYFVAVDGIGARWPHGDVPIAFQAHELAPLLDDRCSDFIADMERFAHLAEKDKVRA